ncbi:MAG: class I SAM-dependent methyltransferase [Acidobacteriia bacterium]|nr:class I SAM-dependent methyltransferase [Terriglobia bacterium]
MTEKLDRAVAIQRQYYKETAARYDDMHAHEGDDAIASSKLLHSLVRMVDARTLLDVGAGTGRGIRHLLDAMPHLSVLGVEPVAALIAQAVAKNGIPPGMILQGVGEALPFADASCDVVCSFGILHHIQRPDAVIREMLRVAKKMVLIADSNRFGQGSYATRLLKLALYKAKLWPFVNFLKTRGRGYQVTPGDGLAYSYSVYDSFDCIAEWADQLILVPAPGSKAGSWLHPLLTSPGVIVCALKEIP